MSFAKIRSVTRTWSFRLTAWSALLVVVTAVATLVALREGVRFTLLHELDSLLLEDVREIDLSISALDYPQSTELLAELDRKAQGHAQHGWFVQLLDEQGDVVWASFNAPTLSLNSSRGAELRPVSAGRHRFVEHWSTTSGRSKLGVRVGASFEAMQADLARIDRLVVLVVSAVLLFAPLGGFWLATRIRRPWANIVKTTEQLRPSKLDERLPIRNTGDELDQLSLAFNRLLDRIANYLKQKNDFLANAAHELRTPLAAIRSTIEVSLSNKRSPQEYEQLLADVLEESASLEVLVNQLLLLSETEADSLRIHGERVDFRAVVDGAVEMFRGVAEYRGIQLEANELPVLSVEGNRHHLRQVLNNLLDNALKFTPPGGRVRVVLRRDDIEGRAVLEVNDTGLGIPAGDLQCVFDRFFRCDRSRRRDSETRGTGLGLSICQAIVNAHGGKISVHSETARGTTFTVSLPLADPASDAGVVKANSLLVEELAANG
jgi:heavy metal sensor kinase